MTTAAHAGSIQVDGHTLKTASAEKPVVVDGDSTATVEVACPTGFVATSGGFLADSVDDGDLATVFVTRSDQTSGAAGWTVTVRNDNDGRAQGKVKVSCLANATDPPKDGHTHALQAVTTQATPATSFTDGVASPAAVTCPAGSIPIRPRYVATAGAVAMTQAQVLPDGSFKFAFQNIDASAVTAYVDCLPLELGSAGSPAHAPELAVTEVGKEFSARSGLSEADVVCPTGAVSLLSSFAFTDPGVTYLGSDPRGTQRMLRFLNDLDDGAAVAVGATCLRSERSARTITIGSLVSKESATKLTVPVTCNFACTVTVKLFPVAGGKALAVGKATLTKGAAKNVVVRSRAGFTNNPVVVKAAAGSIRATRTADVVAAGS